jgi:hypothetical protein
VKCTAVVIILICLVGCAQTPEQHAIAVTRRFLKQHHLPVPTKVHVAASYWNGFARDTGRKESIPCYDVWYYFPTEESYSFVLRREGFGIVDFVDGRNLPRIPGDPTI